MGKKAIATFALLVLSVLTFSAALAETQFDVIHESFEGRDYEVHVPRDGEKLDIAATFPGEALLGFTGGHAYLIVGGRTIEGAILPIPGNQRDKLPTYDGILIRFPDLPKERVKRAVEALAKEPHFQGWSLSCVKTACADLRTRLGISLKSGDGVFLNSTFKDILRDGFVDEKGNPVRFEIYKTQSSENNLEDRARSFNMADVKYTFTSVGAMLEAGLIGAFVYYYTVKPLCRYYLGRIANRIDRTRKASARIEALRPPAAPAPPLPEPDRKEDRRTGLGG